MPKLKINDKEIIVEDGLTVLQACEQAGAEIPRFCYHERLNIAGNCRMCLVDMEKSPKPIASCAMPVSEGMVIHTDTPRVKKAREGVMEFLLLNHPLDCPICDQGGECDLQDQAMAYGRGFSRYQEEKRAVIDKDFGPLVKTHMTRCIHCTRCIRFANEIAGVEEIGAIGRGEDMEITTYLSKAITSELSGNIIDLCPVGALTSKPYEFKARSWELHKTETVDVLDAVGSNIRVDSRALEVMRVLPRLNEDINEEWISDKTRFACDGLKVQRLDRPYIKVKDKFVPTSFDQAYKLIAEKINETIGKEIAIIAGDLVDLESLKVAKDLFSELACPNIDCRQGGEKFDNSNRCSYLFNTSIAAIEQADLILLVGCNPRQDAVLVNARIRKTYLTGKLSVASIGDLPEMTYPVEFLGKDIEILSEILSGKHPFSKNLKAAIKPMIILGNNVVTRDDGEAVISIAQQICNKYKMVREDWNGFNILHTAASMVGGLDVGFVPGKNGKDVEQILDQAKQGKIKLLYLLGADELDCSKLKDCFVVYQGHHGDNGAHAADVILPGCAYTEKDASYVNLEGRMQRAMKCISAPGEARDDRQILLELANILEIKLPYDSLDSIRKSIKRNYPHLAISNQIIPSIWQVNKTSKKLSGVPVKMFHKNFYLTNPIARASKTMAKCASIKNKEQDK